MRERLTRRNLLGHPTLRFPAQCQRCDEYDWNPICENGDGIADKICEIEDVLYDEFNNEIISLEDLKEIIEAIQDDRLMIAPNCKGCANMGKRWACENCLGDGDVRGRTSYYESK